MEKTEIPKGLPKCELIEQLARKARQRTDTQFDFMGTLERFRKQVGGEVRRVEQVFPEFTPHDEEHHLTPLFHAADKLLEKKRLTAMNSVELMILAVGLYGHDWGMAVSDPQKECILRGELAEDSELEELWVSRKETRWLGEFARQHRIAWDANEGFVGVGADMWREYVRQTHAARSGERVRRFFEKIDRGLGHAGGRVCEAHCLSFEELRHADSYPVNFSLLGEPANLRALGVYVRLVDLFDLSEARTPYVIWKFVAPRDPRSKMEWEKHRVVHSVTFPTHQDGRVVHVEGSTDDHEAYAALEDLRHKCDDELRGCSDILDRMRDPRHTLDLYGVSWRVSAIGFEPVSIQFEFDRDQMFEILSDEIYQGDPYVFLRELLQNSIDAIRMRREVLERRGPGAGKVGVIRVTVDHAQDGDAIVTWQDDGIGMDEFVVRNYLAVAGKSYYRSVEFEREGLEMDPISRFGIGLLSCFMVANRVDIETCRDPYLHPRGEPLSIKIPAMRRQFRIERRPQEGAKYGTTIRVFLEGSRLPTDEHGAVQPLDVTEYLATVAGFVDFPILVTDGDRKTIILHPRQDGAEARNRLELGEDWEVRQLDLSYPWSEAILPQDLGGAKESLQEHVLDLAADLGLDGYEGVMAYLAPRDCSTDLSYRGSVECSILHRGAPLYEGARVRRTRMWESYPQQPRDGVSRSGTRAPAWAVYRDGIIIPSARPPAVRWRDDFGPHTGLPSPTLLVNLRQWRAPRTDLGRTELLDPPERWDAPVYQAHAHRLSEEWTQPLLRLPASDRYYHMGWLIACHGVGARALWEVFPHSQWPLALLEAGGRLAVAELEHVENGPLYLPPIPGADHFARALSALLFSKWVPEEEYRGFLLGWAGDPCVVCLRAPQGTAAINGAAYLSRFVVEELYSSAGIRFLTPPWEGEPPLLQAVLGPKHEIWYPNPQDVLEKAAGDPTTLDPSEWAALERSTDEGGFRIPWVARFPEPFEESFAYGNEVLNLNHHVVQEIIRLVAAARLSMINRSLPEARIGRLQDAFAEAVRALPGRFPRFHREQFSASLLKLWEVASDSTLLADLVQADDLALVPEEFVPGTSGDYYSEMWPAPEEEVRPFGEALG